MYPVWIVLSVLVTLGGAERFNCRGRILGAYYADAKSGCKAFHVCVRVAGGGIRDFRFFCPPGTLFHQEAQTCTDWGDDDPLACPADLYDGQFDLYKIGSGFDTKKLSAPAKSEDETEFGLQRAETGDRRLQQNNGASDLRTAHSSDFFSGQRDRGRDDSPPSQSSSRQSFRRVTTPRSLPSTTQYTTSPPPPPPPQRQTPKQYDVPPKPRKLLRKRPIYIPSSNPPSPPTTYAPTYAPTTQTQSFSEQNRFNQQQYKPTVPQPSVPPQFKEFKDEYVEVSRVTPKTNKYFLAQSTGSPQFSISTTAAPFSKKEGLVELFNYDTKSTPSSNAPNVNRPFKVRNSYNVVPEVPREQDFVRTKALNSNNVVRNPPSTVDYNNAPRTTTLPPYKNFNSVSYEPEKNNYVSPGAKQNYNYFNGPSTTPVTTTYYTTTRSEPPANLNTVAYNTNNGFNALKTKFGKNNEDDGQYRLPQGEDDGQYRPELYERDSELLSGAHSLNIAASGNRLPEDQKSYSKTQNFKPVAHTAAPRPFRIAPTPPATTTVAPEVTTTTTFRPPTVNTQRTFDYYQTYTTTSHPETSAVSKYVPVSNIPVRPSTTPAVVRTPEPVVTRERPQSRPSSFAPTKPAKPSTQVPHFAQPANNKEDNSYDYAYYDSDPGFSEYDRIEEFGKTKSKA